MPNNEIFDADYVIQSPGTEATKEVSEVKKLLKDPFPEKEMTKYGTSKPKRVIIKACNEISISYF